MVGFTFQDLKHTAGTALVTAGVDIKTAQARLGHASPITTLKVYEQADRAAAEAIGKQLRPPAAESSGEVASPSRDGRGMVPISNLRLNR